METLITGAPGTGKTQYLIDQLKDESTRPVYFTGIPELTLGWHKLTDPINWHLEVPDGAIIVIDECQQYFPTRPPKESVPESVKILEVHRHRGWDVYFITQYPTLLDHHARRLVGRHIHLKRPKGMKFANIWDSDVIIENPNDKKQLWGLEKRKYKYNPKVWELYKSAEVHTHKARIPRPVFYLAGAIVITGIMVYLAMNLYGRLTNKTAEEIAGGGAGASKAISDSGPPPPMPKNKKLSAKEKMNTFIPVIPSIPWSAPVYLDQLSIEDMPVIAGCGMIKIGNKKNCFCNTQQGARANVSIQFCENYLTNGWHNPFDRSKSVEQPSIRTRDRVAQQTKPVADQRRRF